MRKKEETTNRTSYRPEGWNNPYNGDPLAEDEKTIFEAGASTMFHLLLKEALEYSQTANHYLRHDDYLCDVLAQGVKL
jgi:hypothetical protein